MTIVKMTAIAASVAVLLATAPAAFAQQGTTLAGPAQGSKADGSSSTRPSGAGAGDNGAAGGSSSTGGTATGTMSGGSTATGGNAGGAAGRN